MMMLMVKKKMLLMMTNVLMVLLLMMMAYGCIHSKYQETYACGRAQPSVVHRERRPREPSSSFAP